MQNQSSPITSCPTVQKFLEDLSAKGLPAEEVQARLKILEEFASL